MLARNPWGVAIGRARCVRRSRRLAIRRGPRPHGIPRPQRRASAAGGADRQGPLSGRPARPRSVCCPAAHHRAGAGRACRSDACFVGQCARVTRRMGLLDALSRGGPRRTCCRRHERNGRRARLRAGRNARPRDGPDAERLAAVPDARAAACGRARRSTRRAAPTAFATSCRTCMALTSRGPAIARGSICCARPGGSSSKATCSTGGCRHSGQGVRTRISDDRVWLAVRDRRICRRHRRSRASSTRSVPFLEGPPLTAGRARCVLPADGRRRAGALFEHCARGLDRGIARPARMACR